MRPANKLCFWCLIIKISFDQALNFWGIPKSNGLMNLRHKKQAVVTHYFVLILVYSKKDGSLQSALRNIENHMTFFNLKFI